jgi:hypothetical protein
MNEQNDYASIENDIGCLDYRTIADIMTINGMTMGHSTVRNIIIRSMEKIAASLMAAYGVTGDPLRIAQTLRFQKLIAIYIQEIYGTKIQH